VLSAKAKELKVQKYQVSHPRNPPAMGNMTA